MENVKFLGWKVRKPGAAPSFTTNVEEVNASETNGAVVIGVFQRSDGTEVESSSNVYTPGDETFLYSCPKCKSTFAAPNVPEGSECSTCQSRRPVPPGLRVP